MTKKDFLSIIRKKYKIKTAEAEKSLEMILWGLEEVFSQKEYVKIKNFGTFKTETSKPRKCYDVNTGEQFISKPKAKLTFKAGKNTKTQIV